MTVTLNPAVQLRDEPSIVTRPASARVAVFGGSMGDYNFYYPSANIYDLDNRGLLTAAHMRGADMTLTNYAVAGSTCQNVWEQQIPSLVPGAFDFGAVLVGGNDILNGVSPATTADYFYRIIDAIHDAGAQPLIFTPPPSSGSALNSTQFKSLQLLMELQMEYPDIYKIGASFDAYARLVNKMSTSNAYLAGRTYDLMHPCWAGSDGVAPDLLAFLQAQGVATRVMRTQNIQDTWTACGASGGDGINLCDTGVSFMQGSSGSTANLGASNNCSFSGTMVGTSSTDKWTLYAHSQNVAGMSVTISTATDTDGATYLQLAATFSSAGQYLALVAQNLASRATNGKYYDSEASVQVIGGTVRPAEVCLMTSMAADQSVRAGVGNNNVAVATLVSASATGVPADATYLLHTPRKQYLTAYGVLQPVLRFTSLAAGTCTFRIKLADLREHSAATGA